MPTDHIFTIDNAHASGHGIDHWNAGSQGTFHGNHTDVHIGGTVHDNGGHIGVEVNGGVSIHVTPTIDVGANGYWSSGGNNGGGISLTGHF